MESVDDRDAKEDDLEQRSVRLMQSKPKARPEERPDQFIWAGSTYVARPSTEIPYNQVLSLPNGTHTVLNHDRYKALGEPGGDFAKWAETEYDEYLKRVAEAKQDATSRCQYV